MEKTVVGLMNSRQEAESVVRDLMDRCHCSRPDVGLMARGSADDTRGDAQEHEHGGAGSGAAKGAVAGAGVGGVIGLVAGMTSLAIPGLGPFIAAGPIASALAGAGIGAVAGGVIGALTKLGVPEEEAHYYAEGVKRGGTLITVHARSDAAADCAAGVMRRHGAADIGARAEEWRREGWQGRFGEEPQAAPPRRVSGSPATGKQGSIPVVEENLEVGKRQVEGGGVRVYSRVQERPVQETVHLRDEKAAIERRPVDRPLQAGDGAFQERSIEVNETREEPVVQKRARVVEEVDVKKRATERDETVRDTVRRTDVKVDRGGTGQRATRSGRSSMGGWSGPERRAANGVGSYGGPDRRRSGPSR